MKWEFCFGLSLVEFLILLWEKKRDNSSGSLILFRWPSKFCLQLNLYVFVIVLYVFRTRKRVFLKKSWSATNPFTSQRPCDPCKQTACEFSRGCIKNPYSQCDISRYVRDVTPFSSCPSVGRDFGTTGESPERALVIKRHILGEYTTLYGYINTQRATLSSISRWKLNYEVRAECSMCAVKECPWAGWRADVSFSLVSLLASCIDIFVSAASWSFLPDEACQCQPLTVILTRLGGC